MYDFRFDIAGLLIGVISFAVMTMKRNYLTREMRVFMSCIVLNTVSALCNIIATLAISNNSGDLVSFAFLAKFVHFITIFLMVYTYLKASLIRIRENGLSRIDQITGLTVVGINLVLLSTSLFTKFYFYFDQEYRFRTSFLYYIGMILNLGLIVYGSILSARYERKKDVTGAAGILIATMIVVIVTLVNGFIKGLNIFHLAASILLLLVLIIMYNPQDYIAQYYGCFNDEAYKDSLLYHKHRNKPLHSIGICCEEMNFIRTTYSDMEIMTALKPFVEFARSRFGMYNFYAIEATQFVVEVKGNAALIESTMTEIRNYFMDPISIGGVGFVISPLFAVVEDRESFDSVDSYFEALSYCMNHIELFENRNVLSVTKNHLANISHEHEVVLAVTRAIKNNGVSVFYQPIYNVATGSYSTSEALVRIKDEKLGFIPPSEFIPILERNGLIVELGEIILERVCMDYHAYDFPSLGVERVEVNLSIRQLIVPGMYKKLLNIMKKHDVPKDAILFEITESYNSDSAAKIIRENIDMLTRNGIMLALDDFGTGYSTLIYLISLPFDIIKIDKSLLDNAMADLKSMVLLRNTVNLLIELKKKIVVEGVETNGQAKMLKGLGVHYFQGYLYSRPVNVDEYVRLLKPAERSVS